MIKIKTIENISNLDDGRELMDILDFNLKHIKMSNKQCEFINDLRDTINGIVLEYIPF